MWEQVADTARSLGADSDVVLRAASEMWQVFDTYSQELAEGYRQEASAQALAAEQQRSALFQALFEGHLAATNPWEAAELLRLPPAGPLVVIAAEVPAIGRHALARPEQAMRDAGLSSTWRLQPDAEIGVVALPDPGSQLDRLAARFEPPRAGAPALTACRPEIAARSCRRSGPGSTTRAQPRRRPVSCSSTATPSTIGCASSSGTPDTASPIPVASRCSPWPTRFGAGSGRGQDSHPGRAALLPR
jgi:hypothetical protein